MAEFKYEFLSPEDQATAINARLEGLERDHLQVSVDVEAAGDAGNPYQEERLTKLTETIEGLRARVKALKV